MAARLSLTVRVVLLAALNCAIFALLLAWLIVRLREEVYGRNEDIPRLAVETATSLVQPWVEREQQGLLDRESAQRSALEVLRRLRFSGENYVWVNDRTPRMVMHPFKPELEGKDLSDYVDPRGTHLFREMVRVVGGPSGSGLVQYQWPKPGQQEPVGKVSYVRLVPAWGWIIGAGVYTDDVQRAMARGVWMTALLGALAMLFILGLSATLARMLGTPLERAISSLGSGAAELVETSGSVASASREIADNTAAEASALQESTRAVNTVTSTTTVNAKSAQEARSSMATAAQAVEQANASMTSIVTRMTSLTSLGQETGRIVKTIDEISFQTNLLALNAAVEAARAGDAGAGFAVVASEVRSLAQRAAEAARTTAELIEQTVKGIGEGRSLVEQTSRDFQHLTASIRTVSELVASISSVSGQQADNTKEVSTTMALLNRTTEKNAGSAQVIARSAQQLDEEAHALQHVVESIERLVKGRAA